MLRLDGQGRPEYIGETATGGVWPRHFALIGESIVVANERSHELTVLPLSGQNPLPAGASHPDGVPQGVALLEYKIQPPLARSNYNRAGRGVARKHHFFGRRNGGSNGQRRKQ